MKRLLLLCAPLAAATTAFAVAAPADDTPPPAATTTTTTVAGAGRVTGYFEHFEQKLQRIGTRVLIGCCLDQVTTFVDVFDSDPSADAIFSNRTMRPPWRAVKTSARIGDELRLFSGTVTPP